jgi:OOP family OmpA-OmpF porin
MKNTLLTMMSVLVLSSAYAQTEEKMNYAETPSTDYNRWSVELGFGVNKALRPFTSNHFTSTPSFFHTNLGVRYMLSPMVGFKLGVGYDNINSRSNSVDFNTDFTRYTLEGVINAGRLLKFEDWTNTVGLLVHAGGGFGTLDGDKFPKKDDVFSVVGGATLQFKLSPKFVLTLDGSALNNFGQTYTWDGGEKITGVLIGTGTVNVGDNSAVVVIEIPNEATRVLNRFVNVMFNGSVGVTYYLGSRTNHADWSVTKDIAMRNEVQELESRLAALETGLTDSDQDGIPDMFDAEPNSMAGVAVDQKGRTIDRNNNGVADELERYFESKYGTDITVLKEAAKNADFDVKRLINEGYINAYFDFNSRKATSLSVDALNFIRNYLTANSTATAEIIGYADEIGGGEFNDELSLARAQNVRQTLIESGINGSRLIITANGEDASVDKSSKEARMIVRRVTFKIK